MTDVLPPHCQKEFFGQVDEVPLVSITEDALDCLLNLALSPTCSPIASPITPIQPKFDTILKTSEASLEIEPHNAITDDLGGNSRSVILIDSRSMFQFNESHVRESVNVSRCPLFEKRIKTGKLRVVEYLESRVNFNSSTDIVIYDDNPECAEDFERWSEFTKLIYNSLHSVLNHLTGSAQLHVLKGGYDAFRAKYPQHCTNGVPFVHRFMGPSAADDECAYLNFNATEITPNIFIGGLHDASSADLLNQLGITHIINCAKTTYTLDKKYNYITLEYADNLKQSLSEKLKPAFDEIEKAEKANGKILVHCYAGISRSAAIVIAYLMQKNLWTYDATYQHVKSKRTIIAPNINFVAQLTRFEATFLRAKESTAQQEAFTASDEIDGESRDSVPSLVSRNDNSECRKQFRLNLKCKRVPPTAACIPMQPLREDAPMEIETACEQKPPKPKATTGTPATTPGGRKKPLPAFMKRRQLSGLKVPTPRPGFRYDDIASAPVLPAGYNPFAEAFRKANNEASNPPKDSETNSGV